MHKTSLSILISVLLLSACVPSTQTPTQSPPSTSIPSTFTPTVGPSATPTAAPIPPVPAFTGTAAPSLPATNFQNKVYQKGNTYYFEYTDNTTTIQYAYLPETGSLHDLTVKINNEASFYPSNFGGPYFIQNNSEISIGQAGSKFQLSSSQPVLDANGLQITWKAIFGKEIISYNYHFSISGKSLRIDISSDTRAISKFSLDRSEGTPGARVINIPYLTTINLLLFNNTHFLSVYFDWTQSNASDFQTLNKSNSGQSAYFGQVADYLPNTNNVRNPIYESAYITVSNRLDEVLPTIPNLPSPYRQVLAGRVVLDLWGDPFAQDAALLDQLKQAGISNNALVIKHAWQKCGYDNCYPSVIPANDDMGGDAGLIQLSKAAHDAGYLFALHENYVDIYQNSDIWNPKYVALDSNKNQILAWYNPDTQIQSYRLSPTSALNLAIRFSPWIHSRYGTTAAYLDGNSAAPPSYFEDYNALVDGSAQQITTFKAYAQLLAYERLTHNGPVLSEGDNHFMYAGLVDGAEAQFEYLDYTKIQPVVDFDLLKIHPLAVNHGMGYYERFFGTAGDGYQQKFDFSDFKPEGFYMYMSTEIAFCHAGFVSSPERLGQYTWFTQVQREVSLVLPIQQRCALAKPTSILYNVDGNMVGVEQALIKNQAWQVYVSYDSGLQVYVNRDPSKNWTVTPSSTQSWVDYSALVNNLPKDYVGNQSLPSYTLPPNGWVAFMP
jgi:hypothetical protein